MNDTLSPVFTGDIIKGETMDFAEILPMAKQAQSGEWKDSPLSNVKEDLLKQP